MKRLVVAVALVLAMSACSKDKSAGEGRGLPPREGLELPKPKMGQTFSKSNAAPGPAKTVDPHAGMDIANDPRSGMFAKDKAAADGDPASPHAGVAEQAVDPSKFIKGTIAVSDELASLVSPNDILFISVVSKGDAGEQTLALTRLDVTKLPMAFDISSNTAMFTGRGFDGDVTVIARIDRDGEARTRAKGDLEGRVDVTIPAVGVALTLDSAVKLE